MSISISDRSGRSDLHDRANPPATPRTNPSPPLNPALDSGPTPPISVIPPTSRIYAMNLPRVSPFHLRAPVCIVCAVAFETGRAEVSIGERAAIMPSAAESAPS
jgi:hypothetical protein